MITCENLAVSDFDPALPIALPRLTAFSEADLLRWFVRQGMQRTDAEQEASTLFAETAGDPAQVFVQLMGCP